MALSVGEHLRCVEGTLLNNRYRVVKEVGCGNFAKVYKCMDTTKPTGSSPVAVKVLKREYTTDATFEHDILKSLRTKAVGKKVVQLLDQFTFQRYPCFVFALKGSTLRSRKMGVKQGRVSMSELRHLVQEMLSTLAFLHADVKMVHTDLKPENILLDNENISSESIGDGWTIADFGSASFYRPERPDSDLISTRPYRAPEVVLGMPWSPKADIWSMACIFFEVYYGGRLFEVHDDHEHLARFEQRLGRVPSPFARPSKHFRRFFDDRGLLLPRRNSNPAHISRPMSEILVDEPEFFDLLNNMMRYDPNQRLSAIDALRHPFLSGSRGSLPRPTATSRNSGGDVLADKENAPTFSAAPLAACVPSIALDVRPKGSVTSTAAPVALPNSARWAQGLGALPTAGRPSARGFVNDPTRRLF